MGNLKYGLASPAEVSGKTGLAVLREMIEGKLPQPPIAKTMSFLLTEAREGFAAFEGEPGEHLLNPMGGVHGGWALTLIDSATGCAAQTLLPAGFAYATIETKGNLSRPITRDTGRVRAEAHVLSQGRQIISAEARVLSRDGKVLAHGTSTLLILSGGK
jgi:uncharacterized protein (TIGR00369 family)